MCPAGPLAMTLPVHRTSDTIRSTTQPGITVKSQAVEFSRRAEVANVGSGIIEQLDDAIYRTTCEWRAIRGRPIRPDLALT